MNEVGNQPLNRILNFISLTEFDLDCTIGSFG
jgi:hypothetical protein